MKNKKELIQNFKIGDEVLTSEGYKKIIYIGWNETNDIISNFKFIKKNKISENIPNDDLYLSNGHSIFIKDNNKNDLMKNNNNEEFYKNAYKFVGLQRILMEDFKYSQNIINNYNIKFFHIVLENNDKDKQYVIYTNNLMSESMSENYQKHSKLNEYFSNN